MFALFPDFKSTYGTPKAFAISCCIRSIEFSKSSCSKDLVENSSIFNPPSKIAGFLAPSKIVV